MNKSYKYFRLLKKSQKTLSREDVVEAVVCKAYKTDRSTLHIKRRLIDIVEPRQVIQVILHRGLKIEQGKVALYFLQDSRTLPNSIRRVTNRFQTEKGYRERFSEIVCEVNARLGIELQPEKLIGYGRS